MRQGGRLCGALRFRAERDPSRTVVCHCTLRIFFCPRCGTTVYSMWEADGAELALLGGTFDDTSWISVDRHVWIRSKQQWFSIPP